MDAALTLSQLPNLLPVLFELMQTGALVDGAVSLAQELLAAGPDLFVLTDVTGLHRIVPSLPPRALSLFCRTLAALFSKPEPPSSSPLPPPECVPPNLCPSCANRGLLVDIPGLLPRIVALLRSPAPPRRLWPAHHLYSPHGPIRYSDIPDDTWTSLRRPLHPRVQRRSGPHGWARPRSAGARPVGGRRRRRRQQQQQR